MQLTNEEAEHCLATLLLHYRAVLRPNGDTDEVIDALRGSPDPDVFEVPDTLHRLTCLCKTPPASGTELCDLVTFICNTGFRWLSDQLGLGHPLFSRRCIAALTRRHRILVITYLSSLYWLRVLIEDIEKPRSYRDSVVNLVHCFTALSVSIDQADLIPLIQISDEMAEIENGLIDLAIN
jgi:hypothetical protein